MTTDRQAQAGTTTKVQSTSNSKNIRMSKPPSFGGRQDDSRSSTEARLASSESGDDSSDTDKGLRSPEGCCTVNVTTTFVPHKVMAMGRQAIILRENGFCLSSDVLNVACSLRRCRDYRASVWCHFEGPLWGAFKYLRKNDYRPSLPQAHSQRAPDR